MSGLSNDQQEVYEAVLAALATDRSSVDSLDKVSAVGNEDTSLPVVTSNGQLVTILIGTLVALSAQNLSQSLALWAGPASPSTDPGSSPYNKVYLACESGSYSNFLDEDGHVITLEDGEVALIRRKTTYWEKETLALLNKAFALAAAENANAAADAVLTWFGEDDSHGIRKTWSDWFSNTLSTGVRKVWTTWFGASASAGVQKTWSDWFEDIKSSWSAWFGATSSAGIRKTWSDWLSETQSAWSTWFGEDDSHGIRKTWSDWLSDTQSAWSTWFGASTSAGVRKAWSDWFNDIKSSWTAWFGSDSEHGIRGEFITWFRSASSGVNDAISSAGVAARAANDEAQNLAALKRDCTDSAAAAIAAAQEANEQADLAESIIRELSAEASVTPDRMVVVVQDPISVRNHASLKVGVTLYPTFVMQNYIIQHWDGDSAAVDPLGNIVIRKVGQTRIWVIPTGNTSLAQQVSVNVREPRLRFTSTGKLRLTGSALRIH